MSDDSQQIRHDVPGLGVFAILTESTDANGIRMIMSNLTLNVSSDDIILICENVDQNITDPIIIPALGKSNRARVSD